MEKLRNFLNFVRSLGIVKQTNLTPPPSETGVAEKKFSNSYSCNKGVTTHLPQKH